MKEILFATGNIAKVDRFYEKLLKKGILLKSLKDIDIKIDVDENGKTAKENAIKKAIEYFKETKMSVIAEDSGLYIDKFSKEEQPRAICAKNKWKRRFR